MGRRTTRVAPPCRLFADPVTHPAAADAGASVFLLGGNPGTVDAAVELRGRLPTAWFVALGGWFSFVAGEIPRAPATMQRLGLEWLCRMAEEPKRLYRRYLFHGIPFLHVLVSALAFRFRHAARVVS